MRTFTLMGVLLIVVGVISLLYQGISYTKKQKVVDIGPVEITQETKKTVPLPPILGGVALVGGIVLVLMSNKRV